MFKEFPDVIIIAPDERILVVDGKEVGLIKGKYVDSNGDYKSKNHAKGEKGGHWLVYKNGEIIDKFEGSNVANPENVFLQRQKAKPSIKDR